MQGALHGRPAATRAATRTTLMRTMRTRTSASPQRWGTAAAAVPRRKPGCCSSREAQLPAVSAHHPAHAGAAVGLLWGRACLIKGGPCPGRACLTAAMHMPDHAFGWAATRGESQRIHFNQNQVLKSCFLLSATRCSVACGQRGGTGHGRHVLARQLHDAGLLGAPGDYGDRSVWWSS